MESFVPIINPPEAAILGVGKISARAGRDVRWTDHCQLRGMLTLCVDHRVANGKYAARFLERLWRNLCIDRFSSDFGLVHALVLEPFSLTPWMAKRRRVNLRLSAAKGQPVSQYPELPPIGIG